jgi:hypothetical protein
MFRITACRTLSALVLTTLFALTAQPALAAGRATAKAPAASSAERLWRWLTDLWGSGAGTTERRSGHQEYSTLVGQLGGFIDPNGSTTTQTQPTSGGDVNP